MGGRHGWKPAVGDLYWEDRGGYPYFIVTQADGEPFGTWDRSEALAIAEIAKAAPSPPTERDE